MAYTITKTVTVINRVTLKESDDLAGPLSQFIGKDAFVVLRKNKADYVLSLSKILLLEVGLNLSLTLSAGLTPLLTDLFVEKYKVSHIPLLNKHDMYLNRLRVFSPLSQDDYQVHFTSVNTPEIRDDVSKRGFLDDLAIVSDDDLSHCLVAVNGIFHRTQYVNKVLYVLDGFRTIRIAGRKDVLIVDTKKIGGHSVVPLTTDNVTLAQLNKPAVVSLQDSIQGKTILPVIDGYLYHRHHDVCQVVDQKKLKLLTNKMPLTQQFRHNPKTMYHKDLYGEGSTQSSRKYSDAYAATFIDKKNVAASVFNHRDFQYSRLTAYHSFLIVLNNPNLFTLQTTLTPSGTPQLYLDYSDKHLSGVMSYACGLHPSHVIWQDPYGRKSIFLKEQDNDLDWQDQSLTPAFIPALINDPTQAATLPASFIDYVSS